MNDLRRCRPVLGTPTLLYVFVGGALISFGMNGLVAWAPTFITRSLGSRRRKPPGCSGWPGLVAGTAGDAGGR
ncbi:MAG: hypothetical protein R2882_01530 [Gemmatimonadales bacterium]